LPCSAARSSHILAGAEDCVWAGTMPLAGKPSHLRFTAIWKRDGQRWQQVARHANIVPQQPPQQP
jgi:hypothetical protein